LPRRLQKWQRLNVADRTADLDDSHIKTLGAALDEFLYLVGDVRNHLHRFTKVLAAPLFADYRFVNLTGGEVVHLFHLGADEALVMSQIEISLGPIVGDEYLTVLERTHRSGVNVGIGV